MIHQKGPLGVSVVMVSIFLMVAGCSQPRRTWDLSALRKQTPSLDAINGHRLGDMVPFPALEGERVVLIACRFRDHGPIRIGGDGPGWPASWARQAVSALERGARGFKLEFVPSQSGGSDLRELDIEIRSIEGAEEAGPRGLGDTLSECDISPLSSSVGRPRGWLVGAEIRMRRARLDMLGESQDASAAEWVGALMHEIGHGLGFSGHVVAAETILVREESRLRAAGRVGLAEGVWSDATLEALYRLRPGQPLGTRPLTAGSRSILREIRGLLQRDRDRGGAAVEIRSSVGDRYARIQWRLSDGSRLTVRLLDWRRVLREGEAIRLHPDRATLRRLAAERLVDQPS
ncbi:MAG: hypothetical protein VCB25_06515 [Myxococcota bacterium]